MLRPIIRSLPSGVRVRDVDSPLSENRHPGSPLPIHPVLVRVTVLDAVDGDFGEGGDVVFISAGVEVGDAVFDDVAVVSIGEFFVLFPEGGVDDGDDGEDGGGLGGVGLVVETVEGGGGVGVEVGEVFEVFLSDPGVGGYFSCVGRFCDHGGLVGPWDVLIVPCQLCC